MDDWSDELYAVFMRLNGYLNRPDVDAAFVARAGVKLDGALFPLLSRIGLSGPISVVELARLVGRNHSTVSRQADKLEALGLVERQPAAGDQRIRLLEPTATGQDMLAKFRAVRRRFIDHHFTEWTNEERTLLLSLLRKMAKTDSIDT